MHGPSLIHGFLADGEKEDGVAEAEEEEEEEKGEEEDDDDDDDDEEEEKNSTVGTLGKALLPVVVAAAAVAVEEAAARRAVIELWLGEPRMTRLCVCCGRVSFFLMCIDVNIIDRGTCVFVCVYVFLCCGYVSGDVCVNVCVCV